MRKINKIIIHCSATPPQWNEVQQTNEVMVEAIRTWHKAKGFNDIGYHGIVAPDGEFLPGRAIDVVGAHVRGENQDSLGICYIGGIDSSGRPDDNRTPEQIYTLDKKIAEWRVILGRNITVHGHNEFANKACPSFDVQADENRRIKALIRRNRVSLDELEIRFFQGINV